MCQALVKLRAINTCFMFFGIHRHEKLGKCKHFLEALKICNANKVLPVNSLGPIVHGLYFSSNNVFSIRCILYNCILSFP